MKKLIMAAALSTVLGTVPTAWSGGLQLDPTGTGSVSGSSFLTGLGNSLGDFLASGLATPGNTGVLYGHNYIPISNATVAGGGELTFVFGLRATSSAVGAAVQYTDAGARFAAGDSYFEIFWTPGAAAHSASLGTGYDDGIWLATGLVSVNPTQGAFLSPGVGAGGPLAPGANAASLTPTSSLFGGATLDIEFTAQNDLYVVNTLSTATIDLFLSDVLNAPYINAPASDNVGGVGGIDPNNPVAFGPQGDTIIGKTGADGVNDLNCIPGFPGVGVCNVQAQMNSTLSFTAAQVPEPATLALAGAALGLMGWRNRRKSA